MILLEGKGGHGDCPWDLKHKTETLSGPPSKNSWLEHKLSKYGEVLGNDDSCQKERYVGFEALQGLMFRYLASAVM